MSIDDSWPMIAIGALLIVACFAATHIRYGMPPHRRKPSYPMPFRLRVILIVFGVLMVALGGLRVWHR